MRYASASALRLSNRRLTPKCEQLHTRDTGLLQPQQPKKQTRRNGKSQPDCRSWVWEKRRWSEKQKETQNAAAIGLPVVFWTVAKHANIPSDGIRHIGRVSISADFLCHSWRGALLARRFLCIIPLTSSLFYIQPISCCSLTSSPSAMDFLVCWKPFEWLKIGMNERISKKQLRAASAAGGSPLWHFIVQARMVNNMRLAYVYISRWKNWYKANIACEAGTCGREAWT